MIVLHNTSADNYALTRLKNQLVLNLSSFYCGFSAGADTYSFAYRSYPFNFKSVRLKSFLIRPSFSIGYPNVTVIVPNAPVPSIRRSIVIGFTGENNAATTLATTLALCQKAQQKFMQSNYLNIPILINSGATGYYDEIFNEQVTEYAGVIDMPSSQNYFSLFMQGGTAAGYTDADYFTAVRNFLGTSLVPSTVYIFYSITMVFDILK